MLETSIQNSMKKVDVDGNLYLINEEENTASVAGSHNSDILIPYSINYESKEYIVTSISHHAFSFSQSDSIQFASNSQIQIIDNNAFYYSHFTHIKLPSEVTLIGERSFSKCFNLKELEIPTDSKLETIDEFAFSFSKIERFTFPSKLVELKKGWCCHTSYLNKINVLPNNNIYCCFDEKFIIGKSSSDKTNYDRLVFCARDIKNIENIEIPSFIEHIDAYSFYGCKGIKKIEIKNDSKLQTINQLAFAISTIESIKIPSQVIEIGKNAFNGCDFLRKVEFENDLKLQKIDEATFYISSIEKIKIPSNVKLIGERAFSNCANLYKVDFTSDSKLEKISFSAFSFSSIVSILVPSNVIYIEDYAFNSCIHLKIIQFNDILKTDSFNLNIFEYCNNPILLFPVISS